MSERIKLKVMKTDRLHAAHVDTYELGDQIIECRFETGFDEPLELLGQASTE